MTKEELEAKIKRGEDEIHQLELTNTWVNNKKYYRELKKAVKYWKKYYKDNFTDGICIS